jgi:phage gpG-like protein
MAVELTGLQAVRDSLRVIPTRLFKETKEVFSSAVLSAHRTVSGNLSGDPMESRTGLLRRSLRTEVSGGTLESLRASLYSAGSVAGTPIVYARIHEYGGTIQAKHAYKNVPGGPYLNIPVGENLTPAGVMRKSARDVFNDGGYIARFRSGKYGVFLEGDLMFVLVNKVEIPARLGMIKASEDEIPGLLDKLRRIAI